MTWKNRFKMLFGVVIIVALVGVLTIMFSIRKGETTSVSASVQAVTYPVGTDYAGTVVAQPALVGDTVAAGDPIVTVQSNTLLQALQNGATIPNSDVFTIQSDGTITVKSTVNGVVEKMDVQQGAFAASGSTIATIAATDKLYVEAKFTLDPKDFGRVQKGAQVQIKLPNEDVVTGSVAQVDVTTVNGKAVSVVKVDSPKLVYGQHEGLIAPGTPVVATMKLRNDDVLARLVESVTGAIGDVVKLILR